MAKSKRKAKATVVRAVPTTRQLTIIHLSDLHFGRYHRFSPGKAIGPGTLPKEGHPTLADTIVRDLADSDPDCPVVICITGDFAETGSSEEFREAESFIQQLAASEILSKVRDFKNIFVVPGNHDVVYSATLPEDRWSCWTQFYNQTFHEASSARNPSARFSFHDRTSDLGAVILCLNSCEYVEKNTPDEQRGVVNQVQLKAMKDFLSRIPKQVLDSSIRIALIHHHPMLIPGLAEHGKGYEAVENANYLLNELRTFGFHLILHGHKHTPFHFSEDSYSAFHDEKPTPILVVAGGSAGSTQLPDNGLNCYNRLSIKWIPKTQQGRILLSTRGLKIREKGRQILPTEWTWSARLIDDRPHLGGPRTPQTFAAHHREFSPEVDGQEDMLRKKHYEELRGNMPVCDVMPSLIPDQHYEVRLWVEPHKSEYPIDGPIEVTWSAGPLHRVITVRRDKDERYCATMHYYGPMLIQARLLFKDNSVAYAHVYARMPAAYQRPDHTIDVG